MTWPWNLKSVKPRAQVIAEAKAKGEHCHFGSLMDLCHEKSAELDRPDHLKEYKGRGVFRGDQVRDETGHLAVFTEQSASASSMSAAKMLDAIGRFPGCASQDSDANKAYTQVLFKDVNELLGGSDDAQVQAVTWISLPRNRRPA